MARLTAHLATAFGTRREGSRAVGLDRPWAVHITGWLAGERGERCVSSPHVRQTADCSRPGVMVTVTVTVPWPTMRLDLRSVCLEEENAMFTYLAPELAVPKVPIWSQRSRVHVGTVGGPAHLIY